MTASVGMHVPAGVCVRVRARMFLHAIACVGAQEGLQVSVASVGAMTALLAKTLRPSPSSLTQPYFLPRAGLDSADLSNDYFDDYM